MAAALDVFQERGFVGASIEEIVARAGFTRGAFYSNFSDKAAVFLALMDAREEARVAQVTRVLESSSPLTVFADLQSWSNSAADSRSRVKLVAEFRAYALREESVRKRLAERERALRTQYERAITGLFTEAGVTPPMPVADLAIVVQVLDTFIPLQRAIDDEVRPGLFYDTLTALFQAAVALAEQREA